MRNGEMKSKISRLGFVIGEIFVIKMFVYEKVFYIFFLKSLHICREFDKKNKLQTPVIGNF